ncbi:hypothetical protein OIU76_014984 [Salix suchowensis]|uniref:NADH dehydrogenase subunit 1 n=1 Tax=Salix suchowensis TaxID=1278906 RepID=A0ABQ9BK93_9ROSI|nr:hypothetical protein OIU76_014984 [Salix suchowensis]KAJ6345498.1 hypothetical protein OIU78_008203 [Salix suchowensis]KAJ6385361.1 hypothetical protein OIU77_028521 [Salix suchowensis]
MYDNSLVCYFSIIFFSCLII